VAGAAVEGQRIRAGNDVLTVIHTPGHAADHVCFWNEASRELYAGDMLVLGSTVMIPAGAGGGLRAYIVSLERIAALAPARVFPGHGPVIDDPLALIAEYIDHRRLRHRQVAACLADGLHDADAIVTRVYPDLLPALGQPLAPPSRRTSRLDRTCFQPISCLTVTPFIFRA
jgi:glyoxylase-like metal-dependent hydrolase (beta-lactamase superfamily II)